VIIKRTVQTGVAELVPDGEVAGAWTLYLNGVAQSNVDIHDPQLIAFDYIRRMVDVIDSLAPSGPLDILHLGAGAMTLPRCLAELRPGSVQTVAEIDRELLAFVLEYLPLPEDALIETVVGDAAEELAAQAPMSLDVVVADIFQGAKIPEHVSTVDFASTALRALKASGCYVANIMDSPALTFARQQASVLREVFPQVAVIADASVLRGRRQGNLLLAATGEGASFQRLVRTLAADPFATRIEYGQRLERFLAPR
jgi:spermidine synthase